MINAAALDIFLGETRVGTIAHLDGDASIFTFDELYLADQDRPTLSLAYKDANGEIITETRSYRTKIEPFFSNLLPEGTLRDYLARRAGVKAVREYHLLAQLGHDLPGAVRALAVDDGHRDDAHEGAAREPARPVCARIASSSHGVR